MEKILVIAPHPDDEVIGVGGTMLKNVALGNEVYVCIVTKGQQPMFSSESVEKVWKEANECHKYIGVKETFALQFPAVKLDTIPLHEINGAIFEIIKKIQPNTVYIPHIGDMHKDHQVVVDAAMVALRPKYFPQVKRIYAYETLSETGWNVPNVNNEFIPVVYNDISDFLDKKCAAMEIYSSQVGAYPDTRSIETITALAKYRGSMMHMKAAEAFMLIRELD